MLSEPKHASRGVPPLPEILLLPDGQKVATSTDPWEILDLASSGPVRLPFRDLVGLRGDLLLHIQHAIAHCLETRSIAHAANMLFRFRAFYHAVLEAHLENPISQVDLPHILAWKEKLNERTLWQLGVVRVLLVSAHKLGHTPCSGEALAWLKNAVLPGNPKGVDVRTRDPDRGAFTSAEVEALNSTLNEAYSCGEVSLSDFAVGHVLLAYGIRARQLAALKEKDLIVVSANDGEKRYMLRIPQAKQRGQQIRESFKVRPCDRRLGRLLELLIEENGGRKTEPAIPEGEWPLFISSSSGHNPPGFEYHRSAKNIANAIRALIEERTEIKANSKRFRHTLAQNMADDGASVYEIAEALGHADTQQVGKYVEARPEMVSRLNHLAEEFTPILQAFAGALIPTAGPEAQSAPKAKLLHDRTLDSGGSEPLGHCGQHSFCDLVKPIGCYTCRSFRAWDDGPHEEILAKLMSDRQQRISMGLSPKIYGINDRTIAAVTRVAQLCKEQRNGTATNEDGRL